MSVVEILQNAARQSDRLGEQEEVIFGLDSQIFEDGIRPEPLHVVLGCMISNLAHGVSSPSPGAPTQFSI